MSGETEFLADMLTTCELLTSNRANIHQNLFIIYGCDSRFSTLNDDFDTSRLILDRISSFWLECKERMQHRIAIIRDIARQWTVQARQRLLRNHFRPHH